MTIVSLAWAALLCVVMYLKWNGADFARCETSRFRARLIKLTPRYSCSTCYFVVCKRDHVYYDASFVSWHLCPCLPLKLIMFGHRLLVEFRLWLDAARFLFLVFIHFSEFGLHAVSGNIQLRLVLDYRASQHGWLE